MTQTPPISAEQVEAALIAAYMRGHAWGILNPRTPEYVAKAARDYADKTMGDPSIPASRGVETEGVTIRPWDTHPTGDDAMEPSEIDVHEGAWAVVIGTNGKAAGWIDTHELFAHQLYRDRILQASPALPVQEQEPVAVTGAMVDLAAHALERNFGLGQPWEEICNMADVALRAALVKP